MRHGLLIIVSILVLAATAHAEVKKLHIGISTGYPPFYFFDKNGQPTGICIDILNQLARAMNISVRYPWKRLLNYAKEGKFDAVLPLFKTARAREISHLSRDGVD